MKTSRRQFTLSGIVVLAASLLVAPGFQGKGGGGGGTTPPPPNAEIAFSDAGIKVMNADGTNVRTVVPLGRNESATNPCWNPFGTEIVFDGQFTTGGVGIFAVNLDGTNRRKVSTTVTTSSPKWGTQIAPSGQRMIAFMDYGPKDSHGYNQVDVFLINPDGTGRINLTNSPEAWEWSCCWGPDGSTLYIARDGNFYDLVKLTLGSDGTGGVQVVSEELVWSFGNTVWQPSFANTTESIVFRVSGDPYSRIYQMDLGSTSAPDLVTLGSSADETSPSFSPNDSKVVFWRGGSSGGIFTVNRDGTGAVRINAKGRAPNWKRPAPGGP